jgi:two-component system CheB/CheR fusion protein
VASAADDGLERILEYVKENRGFDFTGYKRSTLGRRITKRMEAVHLDDYGLYCTYLDEHPEEFAELFDTILINVTSFFRDSDAWRAVADQAIPDILETTPPPEIIRVWVPGVASGEEAYTIAILLCEALGDEAFRERVKIYATDVDEAALTMGRHATYPRAKLEKALTPERLERFFDSDGTTATFRKDLRRAVIFGRHDLVQDPPISKIDFLSCRNTLMYFTVPAQLRILTTFHFALRPTGYLMLGRSEVLAIRTNLFQASDLDHRLFAPRHSGTAVARPIPALSREATMKPPQDQDIRVTGFEVAQCPQLLVDTGGELAAANHSARVLFGLNQKDVGRPLQDLEVSFRPLELRSHIEKVQAERRQEVVRAVEMPHGNDTRVFDVVIVPMTRQNGAVTGTTISFVEVTSQRRLQRDLDQSRAELGSAYEELQSTVEELETTNEELQSTNEELETTNEELQSTNEELETMNEELQSTNEELETINDEFRQRTEELNDVNGFLEAILTSLRSAVVVVNRDVRVQVWNAQAQEMWGLRADEVENDHLMNLDIGLPVDQLHAPLRTALNGEDEPEFEVDAINRRGRPIRCRVRMSALRGSDGAVIGVIVLMDADEVPRADATV